METRFLIIVTGILACQEAVSIRLDYPFHCWEPFFAFAFVPYLEAASSFITLPIQQGIPALPRGETLSEWPPNCHLGNAISCQRIERRKIEK